MEDAKNDAWNQIKELGMDVHISVANKIQVDFDKLKLEDFFDDIDAEDVQKFEAMIEENIDFEEEDVFLLTDSKNPVNSPEFPEKFKDLTESSPETILIDGRGEPRVVKKSSIC